MAGSAFIRIPHLFLNRHSRLFGWLKSHIESSVHDRDEFFLLFIDAAPLEKLLAFKNS